MFCLGSPYYDIYKSFVRPVLNYGEVIYAQTYNESFHAKLESHQYNMTLAIIWATEGTSKKKLYQELGWESLCSRRWFRKLCLFLQIYWNKEPPYFFKIMPNNSQLRFNSNAYNLLNINAEANLFSSFFLPSLSCERNKIQSSTTLKKLKKHLRVLLDCFKQHLQHTQTVWNKTLNSHQS